MLRQGHVSVDLLRDRHLGALGWWIAANAASLVLVAETPGLPLGLAITLFALSGSMNVAAASLFMRRPLYWLAATVCGVCLYVAAAHVGLRDGMLMPYVNVTVEWGCIGLAQCVVLWRSGVAATWALCWAPGCAVAGAAGFALTQALAAPIASLSHIAWVTTVLLHLPGALAYGAATGLLLLKLARQRTQSPQLRCINR